MLWQNEPSRNKWVLIAKVYSFLRDEFGKSKVPLAEFLKYACPIMHVVEPASYFKVVGRALLKHADGSFKVVQVTPDPSLKTIQHHGRSSPSTEVELVSEMVRKGYCPDEGFLFVERISANRNSIMTSSATLKPTTAEDSFSEVPSFSTSGKESPDIKYPLTPEVGDATTDTTPLDMYSMIYSNGEDSEASYGFRNKFSTTMQQAQPLLDVSNVNPRHCVDIDNPWQVNQLLIYGGTEMDRCKSSLYNKEAETNNYSLLFQ